MRSASIAALAALALLTACETPPEPIVELPIVYRQDFQGDPADWMKQFVFSAPKHWRAGKDDDGPFLELPPRPKGVPHGYKPPYRSPFHIALLKNFEVTDFDLECELQQTSRNYGHRDMCLFFGFESNSRYYYTHLATKPDPHAHNIFRVDGAPRVAIAPVPTGGIDWGRDVWRKVRVERRVEPGTIKVFWDGAEDPILVARCPEITWGRVGFGTFDDSGRVRNVVLRAKDSRPPQGPRDPFRPKPASDEKAPPK